MPKAPSSTPMVSIQRPCYAMASTDGQSADITMYGQIVDTQPTDWWTGEPIPGQYIIESEFLSDLQQVEHCSEITIRMDSVGGDAGVSILIHNRLRELAAKGTKLTCIVDGVAMSGGSLIMCACDTVKANPSSLVMIHKCCRPSGATTTPMNCAKPQMPTTHGIRVRFPSISGRPASPRPCFCT